MPQNETGSGLYCQRLSIPCREWYLYGDEYETHGSSGGWISPLQIYCFGNPRLGVIRFTDLKILCDKDTKAMRKS